MVIYEQYRLWKTFRHSPKTVLIDTAHAAKMRSPIKLLGNRLGTSRIEKGWTTIPKNIIISSAWFAFNSCINPSTTVVTGCIHFMTSSSNFTIRHLAMCTYNNVSSVVEFQRWWVLKSKIFGQESTRDPTRDHWIVLQTYFRISL